MKDFFISYNRADNQWAEWIAWTLEEAGYSVVIQAWDFRPGGNFVLDMQRAAAETQKTITVLSESYLDSAFTQPEWAAAFANDPQSLERKLIPIRVENCKPTGMLRPIVYVDLVGLSEDEAKQAVLKMLHGRIKPEQKPVFPGTPVAFPGAVAQPYEPPRAGVQQSNVKDVTQGNTQLSGHQLKALREALIAAFPEKGDLEEMVLDELDERLNTIAQEKNYPATVRKFVEWAEAQGRLREVVIGASRVNPGNPELRTFISEAFETLLNAPDLLPQDLMDTLLSCLRQLQNFLIVAQCCRLTVPGIQTHRARTVENIEDARLGIDVRWLMVLELLFHAYPKQSGDIPTSVEFVDRLQRQSELSVESRTALAKWLSQVVTRCNYRLSSQAQFQDDNSQAQTVTALQGYLLITVKQKITGEGFLVHGFLIVKTIRQNDFTQSQLIPIESLSSTLSERNCQNWLLMLRGEPNS